MKWETAWADHIGGREQQQDRVEVLVSRDGVRHLLIVADGMGGHAGGAAASQAVIDAARRVWEREAETSDPDTLLRVICREGHEEINRVGEEHRLSPRSTCVMLLTDGRSTHWAHIGDSRLYRFDDEGLVERSHDHSVVQMLLDMGKIREEEMGSHPDQNRLTQSLGGDADPEPAFGSAEIRSGEAFLLCSDGLWEMVDPEEMAEALRSASLDRAARRLVEIAAERAGEGSDNVSVALARTTEMAPARTGMPLLAIAGVVAVVLVFVLAAFFVFGGSDDPSRHASEQGADVRESAGSDPGTDPGTDPGAGGEQGPLDEEEADNGGDAATTRRRGAIDRPDIDSRHQGDAAAEPQNAEDRGATGEPLQETRPRGRDNPVGGENGSNPGGRDNRELTPGPIDNR